MNRMLVVVFDNEGKAYEGRNALLQLNAEGSVFLYASAVVAGTADGSSAVRQEDAGPLGTLVGTSLGALIGLLGGPAGAGIGALGGMAVGMIADIDQTRVGGDFIDDVRKTLSPGKAAVVAEVDEDWTTPVDTRMEKLGGTVFRRSLSEVRDVANDEDAAAIKADIAQLEAESAEAKAERKAKLRDRINQLDSKLQARLQKAKERRDAAKRADQVKVEALKAKAASARARAP
ncbi:MAG TPA: DUF1269 domain-containing protein [Thermoanaerobaculaceae bacterium]|nr:DUF1269 domain-containing protein [Thermoanaerobaculaceae bacterium]